MKKALNSLALGLLLLGLNSTAHALVIDFNEIDNTAVNIHYQSLDTQGFHFSNITESSDGILIWQKSSQYNSDPNGATYTQYRGGSGNSLSQISGESFTLNSLDIGDAFNLGIYTQNFIFTGNKSDGTTLSATFTADKLLGLNTVVLNWTGLTSFLFAESGGDYLQADNFVINEGNNTPAVPEPGTIALLGLGMAGLAIYGKRRNNKA